MRNTKWETTLICDRCKKTTDALKSLFVSNYNYMGSCNHSNLIDLCTSCWGLFEKFMGSTK